MEKIIISDCDGVLVNWELGFEAFMVSLGHTRVITADHEYSTALRYNISVIQAREYITEFNEGPYISYLESFADSVKYVSKLSNLGFRFIVISSVSDLPSVKQRRVNNLTHLFGDVFDDVFCIKMGTSKSGVLKKWAGTGYFWIEDHIPQAEAGYDVGLHPILIGHPYSRHYNSPLFPKVSMKSPWKKIFNLVSKQYET